MVEHVVIVGGGITGLSCAFKLSCSERFARGQMQITVLESRSRWGGVIETSYVDDCIIDSGPDSFITNRPEMVTLSRELGIDSRIIAVNAKNRGALIVNQGKLAALPEGFIMLAPSSLSKFFESNLLSWPGKLRSALDLILPARTSAADESLADFVRRRFGKEHLERLAQPMVAGIYVGDAEALSAGHAAKRFVQIERTTGSVIRGLRAERKASLKVGIKSGDASNPSDSGARYSIFAGYDRGMAVVVEALIGALQKPNINLHLNYRVDAVTSLKAGFRVMGKEQIDCDHLVLTTSASTSSTLLKNVDAELSDVLAKIPEASSAVVNFIFSRDDIEHPLNAFGAVVPEVEMAKYNLNALAIAFASVKFDRAPQDKVVIRVFMGGVKRHDLLSCHDKKLIDLALADLRKLIGLKGQPQYQAVHRWLDSMPQYQVGHRQLVTEIEEKSRQTSLHLAGSYLLGVGLPDCVASANQCADNVLKSAPTSR